MVRDSELNDERILRLAGKKLKIVTQPLGDIFGVFFWWLEDLVWNSDAEVWRAAEFTLVLFFHSALLPRVAEFSVVSLSAAIGRAGASLLKTQTQLTKEDIPRQ